MQNEVYVDVGLHKVQADFAAYRNESLRWGGKIINVTNKEKSSQAQLLFYPLDHSGRPQTVTETEGRFMISKDQFLDPAVYKEGVEVTVSGILTGKIKHKVGKKTLSLPILSVKHIHLWPERRQYDDGYYPYYFPYSRYKTRLLL